MILSIIFRIYQNNTENSGKIVFENHFHIWIFTSHGGGAFRYDGIILNVTDPRASRCKHTQKKMNRDKLEIENSITSTSYASSIFRGHTTHWQCCAQDMQMELSILPEEQPRTTNKAATRVICNINP